MRLMIFVILFVGFFTPALAQQKDVPVDRTQITLSYAPLVKRTAPAVVNVYAKTVQHENTDAATADPFFRHFFGLDAGPRERVGSTLGSGVIVDAGGLIVTNNHVIKNATDVRVALADKREFQAKIILADERTDLAVLKIDVTDEKLPALAFANSDDLEVGDLVLAIGNPFGVGQTVTSGIISALARTSVGISDYQFFIQTDAAINPGNSGGALVNMKGELIGINTLIYSKSGGSIGIGFSIPSNMVRNVVQSAEKGEKIIRPWLGGGFQNVTPDIATALGFARPEGVLIADLHPQSPLTVAGLKAGDVIVALDGKSLENAQQLNYEIGTSHVGETKIVEYRRGTTSRQSTITLVQAPESVAREETTITGRNPLSGLVVANLSPAVAGDLDLPAELTGVVAVGVKAGPAQQFFQKGDIIRDINGAAVSSVAGLNTMINQASGGWLIGYERQGQKVYLRLGL